ncbi:MAG: oligopeptide transporter, OPT family [Bacteroidetes bacterium]|nr:MAG: oligopeptide transporter, OPT family [Bacteroidota bacterium]
MANSQEGPFIKADQSVAELTVKALILGALLSVVLSSANAYFGLFAGMTVSASIPAAVISMVVLKAFRNSSILENNLVQTAASAGESVAAGVIFTIPALVIMGYWNEFNYLETTMIALAGGVLGVLFTIPLRRALIVKEKLKFPEGVATAEVLKTGEKAGKSIRYLILGSILGGVMKLGSTAMNLWSGIFEQAALLGKKAYLYVGLNLSPALVAVGYIVGLNIAFLVFLGGAISWYVAIPAHIAIYGPPEADTAIDIGSQVWNTQIRFLGVGAMLIGGIWALISIRNSLVVAFRSGLAALKNRNNGQETPRTERDTPMNWVLMGILVMLIPIFVIYLNEIHQAGISVFMAILMVLAGFLFSAVAGYMAGLVGSSNNPISGVTIATILVSALLLAALMGTSEPARGAAAAIFIGAVVCCAAAIAGDNMQDLKAGHILGATPWKQQVMQMIGVAAGALVMAPVLGYLLEAYGIGAATPETPHSLTAPQATLMQSVAEGIFGGHLPWTMVGIGVGIGALIIAMDQYLAQKGSSFRMPVLAVAVGLYLPLELDTAIFVGGIIAWLSERYFKRNAAGKSPETQARAREVGSRFGLLLASGLITGEAIMGILIAIGIVSMGADSLRIFDSPPAGSYPGLILLALAAWWLYRVIVKTYNAQQ